MKLKRIDVSMKRLTLHREYIGIIPLVKISTAAKAIGYGAKGNVADTPRRVVNNKSMSN